MLCINKLHKKLEVFLHTRASYTLFVCYVIAVQQSLLDDKFDI